jgi:hypothetical protein
MRRSDRGLGELPDLHEDVVGKPGQQRLVSLYKLRLECADCIATRLAKMERSEGNAGCSRPVRNSRS